MDTGQWTVIILSALFMAWFLAGTAGNRRRGDQVLHWVQGGAKSLGRLSEARRIRGSAVQLTIKDPAAPFRRVDLIITLEPRENPPLWVYSQLMGKRDELLIQADLRTVPNQELEVSKSETRPARVESLNNFLSKYDSSVKRLSIKRSTPHMQVYMLLSPLLNCDPGEFFKDLQGML